MNQRNQKHVKNASRGAGLQNISPKTMVAAVLMTLMAILWGRVLLKGSGGPASAKAAEAQTQADLAAAAEATQAQSASVRIERVQLPVLPGRNDVITHNPFGAESWKAFTFHEVPKPEVVEVKPVVVVENTEEKRHRENMKRIAGRLNLEGVIRDASDVPFQAFVDGKILSVGSVLTVQEGPEEYELILVTIEEKEVLFIWNDLTVTLKLTGMVER
jgi:hypothetical protein